MPGQYDSYADGTIAADTTALPSPRLWSQVDAELEKPGLWVHQWEDFGNMSYTETLPTTVDPWMGMRVFTSSGATLAQADEEGGVRTLVEATDNEGLSIAKGIYPFKIDDNLGKLVFEARIKRNEIANTFGFYCGLIEDVAMTAITPIAADGTLADQNLVGFFQPEGDPDGVDTVYKANGVSAVTVTSDAATLVADTYVKLGMVFNHNKDNRVRWYVNAQETATSKSILGLTAGADFPDDVRLGWIFAVLNGATSALSASIDWIRCAQRRVTSV